MRRRRFLVCYDIADSARLRAVHTTMKAFGDPVQYSVFCCDLDRIEYVDLLHELGTVIHHGEDRVMLVDLGAVDARLDSRVEFLGRPPDLPDVGAGPQVL